MQETAAHAVTEGLRGLRKGGDRRKRALTLAGKTSPTPGLSGSWKSTASFSSHSAAASKRKLSSSATGARSDEDLVSGVRERTGIDCGITARSLSEPELLHLGLRELIEAVEQPVGEVDAAL